ncbi:MAG: hypothetical protein LQ338_000152 [Usnochroma carphineum]|nr:MAG: hypothetical protein LQ338_000152 [Usnochroma carphineum]
MRSLLLSLIFALSVSARCVKKQAASPAMQQMKQGVQDGPGVSFNNSTMRGDVQKLANQGGAASTSSAVPSTTSTPAVPSGKPTTSSATGGAAQTSSPSGSSTTTGSANPPAGSGGTSTVPPSTGGGSGNCGQLKGVCFNSGFQPSMYDKITTAADWITFQMGMPGGDASSRTTQDHVPMMPFASNVADAVNLVNGPNPPAWLLTFNEPDYSYAGYTPTMSAQEAADAIKPLLAKPGSGTKFVAPVTANPNSSWLEDFFAACNCKDFFSAYNIHQYQKESTDVIATVNAYHSKWSDKPLWITEVAPGNAGCSVSWDQAGQFMKDIFKFAKGSGFVDRVFWNTGNQLTNGDTNVCNSWLLDAQGNPGPLLATFESVDCT